MLCVVGLGIGRSCASWAVVGMVRWAHPSRRTTDAVTKQPTTRTAVGRERLCTVAIVTVIAPCAFECATELPCESTRCRRLKENHALLRQTDWCPRCIDLTSGPWHTRFLSLLEVLNARTRHDITAWLDRLRVSGVGRSPERASRNNHSACAQRDRCESAAYPWGLTGQRAQRATGVTAPTRCTDRAGRRPVVLLSVL